MIGVRVCAMLLEYNTRRSMQSVGSHTKLFVILCFVDAVFQTVDALINTWTPHCQLNMSAVTLIILMALIATWGLKESSLVNTVIMFFNFGVLLFFLIYGFINFHPEYLTPLFPYQAEGVFRVCMPCMHVTRVWHYCIHTFGHKAVLICVAISYARLLPFSIQS